MRPIATSVIVGSARTGSYSRIVAETLMSLMPGEIKATILKIDDLPLYNQDYDDPAKMPDSYVRFRKQVQESEAFLFVTPEHNRSIPALLKNALDIASRPVGSNVWSGKPGGIVSVSPGAIGGFGANHISRQTLSFLNIYMMQQPEAYVGNVTDDLDASGKFTSERGLGFLKKVADSYAEWVKRFQV